MRDPPSMESAGPDALPPERSEYDLSESGQRAYRRDRTQWYREHTGGELTGSIAEQNEQWDNYKRNFRARGTQAEPEWDQGDIITSFQHVRQIPYPLGGTHNLLSSRGTAASDL